MKKIGAARMLAIAALLGTLPMTGCGTTPPDPSANSPAKDVIRAAKTESQICREERPVGSHVYERVCRPADQVAQDAADAKQLFQEARRKFPVQR